ncbi:MAG: YicC family protein [Desulfobacteraceae bacterium]|nr:MAG: YicC family protein [Desulfobacteraceae bacterium]
MKSMTGYAGAEKARNGCTATVEVRTYNSRFLDVVMRLPNAFRSFEDRAKELILRRLSRGRVEVHLQVRNESESDFLVEIDASKVDVYRSVLDRLKKEFNLKGDLSLDFLFGPDGVIKRLEAEKEIESCWPTVQDCLEDALDHLDAMRRREGESILQDMESRLRYIESCLVQIRDSSSDLAAQYRDRLKERISALTDGMVEVDPARIAQEAAFYADRSDISEEISRAESHLSQYRSIMASEEAAGRRLNFLLQEFNREFNTMGSKAGNAGVSHLIVDVKSELEKIREQVQNVE